MQYASLAPVVAVDVMGAPQPLVIRKIAEAANEFYRLTRSYLVKLTPAAITGGASTVALNIPAGTGFVAIAEARFGTFNLVPKDDEELARIYGDWETRTGDPVFYQRSGASIRVIPYPVTTTSQLLRVKFAVAPLVTADSIADDPGLEHQDALIEGAKALLLAQPKKPWTDMDAAAISDAKFRRRINETRVEIRTAGSQEHQLRVRPRFV